MARGAILIGNEVLPLWEWLPAFVAADSAKAALAATAGKATSAV
jgi:hypothetical protein